MIGLVVGGVCLVGMAALVGRFTDLSPKLKLDVAGERTQGEVESTGDGVYRLRYEHPGGDIYSRRYTGGFGLQSVKGEISEITVVFAMEQPERFQPAGVSYIPAGIAGLLFVAGMGCVLHARHSVAKMRVRNRG